MGTRPVRGAKTPHQNSILEIHNNDGIILLLMIIFRHFLSFLVLNTYYVSEGKETPSVFN
jgi:cytochrome b561